MKGTLVVGFSMEEIHQLSLVVENLFKVFQTKYSGKLKYIKLVIQLKFLLLFFLVDAVKYCHDDTLYHVTYRFLCSYGLSVLLRVIL